MAVPMWVCVCMCVCVLCKSFKDDSLATFAKIIIKIRDSKRCKQTTTEGGAFQCAVHVFESYRTVVYHGSNGSGGGS